MSGATGRSGRKPKQLAALLAANTFRPDRHSKLLPPGQTIADAREALRRPVAARTVVTLRPTPEGLPQDESGKALSERLLATFGGWSESDRLVLALVAAAFDRVRALQRLEADQGLVTQTALGPTPNIPLLRVIRQETESFARLLRQLNLKG